MLIKFVSCYIHPKLGGFKPFKNYHLPKEIADKCIQSKDAVLVSAEENLSEIGKTLLRQLNDVLAKLTSKKILKLNLIKINFKKDSEKNNLELIYRRKYDSQIRKVRVSIAKIESKIKEG